MVDTNDLTLNPLIIQKLLKDIKYTTNIELHEYNKSNMDHMLLSTNEVIIHVMSTCKQDNKKNY